MHSRSAHAAKELEEQRRKHEQFASMMDEVETSDSEDSDDAPVRRRPVRGARRAGPRLAPDIEPTYDPMVATGLSSAGAGRGFAAAAAPEEEPEEIAKFGSAASAALPAPTLASPTASSPTGESRASLLRPVPPGAPARRCYLIRNRTGKNLLSPLWTVYLEDEHRFLMAGKKRMGKKTSNFLITTDPDSVERKSAAVIAKVRANWTGSGYYIFDHGMNPEKAVTEASTRRDLGFVSFDWDTMGPGKMEAAIPRVSASGIAPEMRPRDDTQTVEALYKGGDTTRLMTLANKRPKWDETVKGHVLNFNGRVTMSSVKNFQLACDDTEDATVLQFGRVGKHRFTMDFQYPLSAVQAFGIVLASLDGKLADSKGFSQVKKLKEGGGVMSSIKSAFSKK